MNQETYYLIADIIQRYRTWIEVKDTEKLIEMRLLQDGMLKTLFYKGLSLQYGHENEMYNVGVEVKEGEKSVNEGVTCGLGGDGR